jgi:hypothetical protein
MQRFREIGAKFSISGVRYLMAADDEGGGSGEYNVLYLVTKVHTRKPYYAIYLFTYSIEQRLS